jgi:hypothetical protein
MFDFQLAFAEKIGHDLIWLSRDEGDAESADNALLRLNRETQRE